MPKTTKIDIIGKNFTYLTCIEFVPDASKIAKFIFQCSCGKVKLIDAQSVVRGLTKSCGCLQKELMKSRMTKHGHGSNNSKTRTYSSWASMMDRCEWGGNKIMYKKYGAKGIKVNPDWHDFSIFLNDMGERPENTSIDRINNNDGYSKGNCRWASRYEQSMNTSRTTKVIFNGEEVKVKELCDRLNISEKAVRSRAFRRGKDYAAALISFGIHCSPAHP